MENLIVGDFVKVVSGPYALPLPYERTAEIKGFDEQWIILSINYKAHRVTINEIKK
jgi:hypothetical protein